MRALLTAVALVMAACGSPAVVFPEDTPVDFVRLAEEVFAEFVAAFPAQTDCIGSAEIRAAWELDDRALYDPASDVIEIRVPGTAPQLTTSIVHEMGHRLEHLCPSQVEVRAPFLGALGMSPDSAWPDPTSYETNPSELWAEAVVRHVLGQADSRRPLEVTPAAVAVVADWSRSEVTHRPSAP
jgi:hypothetical protein